MRQITEGQLQTAAERAVANGHAITALLFGSRARGTSGPLSDWDVCLITEEDTCRADAQAQALEAEDEFWDDRRIQTVWMPRTRFDRGVPAGSLEAAIAHEGRVLAGNATMAKKARTVPFEAETVQRNMGRAAEHLFLSIGTARRHTQEENETEKTEAAVSTLIESIAAAEALGRALCALTETEHTGDHRLGKNARQIADRADRADEPNPPLKSALMERISTRVQQVNDTAQAVRKVEYGEPAEAPEKTVDRFVRALEADLWMRQGLIEGTGPWAGLKQHPRRGELADELERRTAARATTNAREWTLTPIKLADEKLDRAVHDWAEGYQALCKAHIRRAQKKANVHTR